MSSQSDADKLFQLYILLQEIMKEHVKIEENLKEIANMTSQENEFEKIATSAASIVQTYEEIESIVAPRSCCSCS